jgi:hypothetical protein
MTTRCVVCGNSDLRRLIELGWNAKMSVPDLVHAFGGVPSHAVIYKHLKEHTEGAYSRHIAVEDARPMRERVMAIQRAQVEAIERQMAIAQQKADDFNDEHREHMKDGGCVDCDHYGFQHRDPSVYFNILSKDMQSAVSSILKAQGLTDKRELKSDAVKVDLFRLMLGQDGGMAPAHLIESGPTVEGEAVEVTDE